MKLIYVDLALVSGPAPAPAPVASSDLLLVPTGEQLVDGDLRHYYATPPPLRLLIAMRAGCRAEDVRPTNLLAAMIGWDEGDNPYVLPHGRGKRHTKLTVERIYDVNTDFPDAQIIALSTILARVPRSDRPGGARSDKLGRPPIAPGDPVEAHDITLPRSMWRRIEILGAGNRSAGVRKLVSRLAQFLEDTQS